MPNATDTIVSQWDAHVDAVRKSLSEMTLETRHFLLELGVDPDRDMGQWETRLRDIDPE